MPETSQEFITRDSKEVWSSEKILTVLAGSALAIYTLKLLHEWWTSEDESDEGKDDGRLAL